MAQKLSYADSVRIPNVSPSLAVTDSEHKLPLSQTSKPVVNVWNVRMEKMAAARAAHKNPVQDKSVLPDADRDDPFVVKLPDHLKSLCSPNPITSQPPPPQPTPISKEKDNPQQDNWPQVGEVLSLSASTSDASFIDDDAKNLNGTTSLLRKTEKLKWVSIPKQELQAAADAASGNRHTSSRRSLRQHPRNPSENTDPGSRAGTSASTSSHPPSQSRTPSQTSASASAAVSLHSSPKQTRVGKKLPSESENQGMTITSARTDINLVLPNNSPAQEDEHHYEEKTNSSGLNKTRNRSSSSQSQSQPMTGQTKRVFLSEPTSVPLPPNQPQSLPPVFYPQRSQLTENHSNSINASNSSSPHLQQLHLLSPSSSAQPPHIHMQHTYPHAPYPLYNLTVPPVNPYNYSPTDPSSHYVSYPPPRISTFPNYGQVGSAPQANGIPTTDRNRTSLVESSTALPMKSNDAPPGREKMVFGSIDIASDPDMKVPVRGTVEVDRKEKERQKEKEKEIEAEREKERKKSFAIGVEDGRDLPGRSKTAQKKVSGKFIGGRPPAKGKTDQKDEKDETSPEDKENDRATTVSPKAEPKWTFGTTSLPSPVLPAVSPSLSISSQTITKIDATTETGDDEPKQFTPQISGSTTPFIHDFPEPPSYVTPPSISPLDPHHHPYHIHLHRIHSTGLGPGIPHPPPISIPMQLPVTMATTSSTSDPDLEVKDYGYGFGDPIIAKESTRDQDAGDRDVGDRDTYAFSNEDVITSPMVEGSVREGGDNDSEQILSRDHIYPRDHHLGRGRRGFPNGRGGYTERGAGSYRRGRGGINGFSRGYGRGYYANHHHNRANAGRLSPVHSRAPSSPYSVTPPHHLQTLPLESGAHSPLHPPPLGGYFHPHPHHPTPGRPYIPPGYEAFNPSPTIGGVPPPLPVDPAGILLGQPQTPQHRLSQGQMQMIGSGSKPPVPVPKTTISFPLDSTRYYLLGQLEYYLSPENMAQDLFLRQRMDARGWIPISLIASFNRVRQLTPDVQLVRDVLTLSSLVQVRGNMVRMGGWEPFVLPDAVPSTVEEQPLPYPYQNLTNYYYIEDATSSPGAEAMHGEVGSVGYPDVVNTTSSAHHRTGSTGEGEGWEYGEKREMNGHVDQDADEDDEEDEVEIVMGQGVGTFMYDRRTVST